MILLPSLRYNSGMGVARTREVRGRVIEIIEEGADAHIDALAQKYLGRAGIALGRQLKRTSGYYNNGIAHGPL
jgi:hypothetical protein